MTKCKTCNHETNKDIEYSEWFLKKKSELNRRRNDYMAETLKGWLWMVGIIIIFVILVKTFQYFVNW